MNLRFTDSPAAQGIDTVYSHLQRMNALFLLGMMFIQKAAA
jgi:hypothetical protein